MPWTEEVDGEILNRYPTVEKVTLEPKAEAPKAGSIKVLLTDTNTVSSSIRGSTIEFRRTEAGSWFCYSDVKQEFLPKGCRLL